MELIQEIKVAFADMPFPGAQRMVNDMGGDDLERKQIREEFSHYTDWQDVPRELLWSERDALSFFEPSGFAFYLPAYMVFAVEDYEGGDSIPDSLVYALTLPDEGSELYEFVRERLALFNEEQGKAILHFLDYLDMYHAEDFPEDFEEISMRGWYNNTPRRAIERWWKRFEI